MTDTTDWRAEAERLRRERDELAARLAEIEAQPPVAWIERITGRLADPTDEHRTRFPMVYSPLIPRPAPRQRVSGADEFPAAAPERAEPSDAELVAAEWPDGFEQAARSMPTLAEAVALFDAPAEPKPCRCRRCMTERGDRTVLMILCPTCGNKRCPHATDHRHACTGSNDPGQPGSWYGGMQERTKPCRCSQDGCADRVSCPRGAR